MGRQASLDLGRDTAMPRDATAWSAAGPRTKRIAPAVLLLALLGALAIPSTEARAQEAGAPDPSQASGEESDASVDTRVRSLIARQLRVDLEAADPEASILELGVSHPDPFMGGARQLREEAPTRAANEPRAAPPGERTPPGTRRPRQGTATRALPRPRPELPSTTPPAGFLEATSPPRADDAPRLPRDPGLRDAYRDAVRVYYAAIEEQNRADLATFTRLEEYEAWALTNRRQIIERQQMAATIILGVVVFLVFTGVVFSGIQFYIALRHAQKGEAPPTTRLKATLSSIEVSSSVLGVVILVISLLFFYLYLSRVFNLAVVAG